MHILLWLLKLVLVLMIGIALGCFLCQLKNRWKGLYLHSYYVVSKRGERVYEMHTSPVCGFYYAYPGKFFRLIIDAIEQFKRRFPGCTLYTITSTLQPHYERRGYIGIEVKGGPMQRLFNYFIIMGNLANYLRRNAKEWQLTHVIRRVRAVKPKHYVLVGGAGQ